MNTLLWIAVFIGCVTHEGWSSHQIDMCNRNLTRIIKSSKDIQHLSKENAVFISLCNNNLTIISWDTFSNFSMLERLILDDNRELKFPASGVFLQSNSLSELSCMRCGVDNLYNQSLEQLPNLEQINLNSNEIRVIEAGTFRNNQKLEEIFMTYNKLHEIPREMVNGLQKLRFVELSHNRDLAPVGNQPFLISEFLEELKCDSCNFSVIYEQTFSGLPQLRELHLKGNKICQIYDTSFNVQLKLKVLNLQNNSLQVLHQNLLEKDIKICLDGNPDDLQCFIQKLEVQQQFNCKDNPQRIVDCSRSEPEMEALSTEAQEFSTSGTTTTADIDLQPFVPISTTTSTTIEPEQAGTELPTSYLNGFLMLISLVQIAMFIFLVLIGIWLVPVKKYDSHHRELMHYEENSYYSSVEWGRRSCDLMGVQMTTEL